MKTRTLPRITAKYSAIALLDELERSTGHHSVTDAFEMIERELSGYLSHPKTKYRSMFNAARQIFFPGGLVYGRKSGLCAGHDLVTFLEDLSKKNPALKNPEFAIRDIVGHNLALQLFKLRGLLIKKIMTSDQSWEVNLLANNKVLKTLLRSGELKPSEITLSRLGVLSFFYYSDQDNNRDLHAMTGKKPHR